MAGAEETLEDPTLSDCLHQPIVSSSVHRLETTEHMGSHRMLQDATESPLKGSRACQKYPCLGPTPGPPNPPLGDESLRTTALVGCESNVESQHDQHFKHCHEMEWNIKTEKYQTASHRMGGSTVS